MAEGPIEAGQDRERARQEIEQEVDRRAARRSRGEVAELVSLANAEDQFRRDYHGRFLIELIQNARDAWFKAAAGRMDGSLLIEVTAEPSLLVGNPGRPVTSEVLLYSIGLVGETTKEARESIGHKGVGIKAILELTDAPEIYSREDPGGSFDIQIAFDRTRALEEVRTKTGADALSRWLRSLPGVASSRGDERVPLLSFPFWVPDDGIPTDVSAANDHAPQPLNTVIRLPFRTADEARTGLDIAGWRESVDKAITGLTDEMVLLLGCFERIRIERDGDAVEIERRVNSSRRLPEGLAEGIRAGVVHDVTIRRSSDGHETESRWWLFEAHIADAESADAIDTGLAVGVRVADDDGPLMVRPLGRREHPVAGNFHLFFPTEIPTNLPFLLHAYFEVDASRRRFAEASIPHNRIRVAGLRALIRVVVSDLAAADCDGTIDATSLPDLFGEATGEPEDKLAGELWHGVMEDLRHAAWVRTEPTAGGPRQVMPAMLTFEEAPAPPDSMRLAFSAAFLAARQRFLLHAGVGPDGSRFLETLEPDSIVTISSILDLVSHDPASGVPLPPLWEPGEEDAGFRALLEVMARLWEKVPSEDWLALKERLSGALVPIVPVVAAGGGRRLVAPQPAAIETEREAFFVRTGERGGEQIPVPPVLRTAFLPDQLISADRIGHPIVQALGIRPYDTNTVLERLASALDSTGSDDWSDSTWREVLGFVAALLLSDPTTDYSLRSVDAQRSQFSPGTFFWVRGPDAPDRRRRRGLSLVRVPTQTGEWRPAGEAILGRAWGAALREQDVGACHERQIALEELALVAPPDATVVADPETLLGELDVSEERVGRLATGDDALLSVLRLRTAHALLLRLGVWETVPMRGTSDWRPRSHFDPWPGAPGRDDWRAGVAETGGDRFDRYGNPATWSHEGWSIGEDYAFLWDPATLGPGLARVLGRAADNIGGAMHAGLLCPRCHGRHGVQYERRTGVESLFAHQLRHSPWLDFSVDGLERHGVAPDAAWWDRSRPSGVGLRTSPLRFLSLASDVSAELAGLLQLPDLTNGKPPTDRVIRELKRLREEQANGLLEPDPADTPMARQAFIALHRRLYAHLADYPPGTWQSTMEELGVLAERNGALCWVAPGDARFDNRRFASYRGAFEDAIAFSILASDADRVADALGVPDFEVAAQRNTPAWERDVTETVLPVIAEALPRLLALLVYNPVGGGTPLRLEGEELETRARRLLALRVVQAASVSVVATETRSGMRREIGVRDHEDVYLDPAVPGRPVLYHELDDDDWLGRLRPTLGAQLAVLADSPSHEDAFARLLSATSEAAQDRFLANRGITPDRIRAVRERLRDLDLLQEELDRRWWDALLEVTGGSPWIGRDRAELNRLLGDAFARLGEDEQDRERLVRLLDQHGGGPAVREASGGGRDVLAAIAAAGVSLERFHAALLDLGDVGLTIGIAERRLRGWMQAHQAGVIVAIAARTGRSSESVRQALARIEPDVSARFDVDPPVSTWLGGIADLLGAAGIVVTAEQLASANVEELLALGTTTLTQQEFETRCQAVFDASVRAELERRNASAWRTSLIPVIVALRCDPGAFDADLREEATTVAERAPSATSPAGLEVWVRDLVPPMFTSVAEDIQAALKDAGHEHQPDLGWLTELVEAAGRGVLLERARAVLARTPSRRVTELRVAIRRLRSAHHADGDLRPTVVILGLAHPPRPHGTSGRRNVGVGSPPDSERMQRAGRDAELSALAATIDYLNGLSETARSAKIDVLRDLLLARYSGKGADYLEKAAQEALSATNGDERDDALIRFLHVSETSPAFGFDLLGFAFGGSHGEPLPMFLEVKALPRHLGKVADRTIHVTSNEWDEAKRLGPEYAFLLVRHDETGSPASLEVIADPADLVGDAGTLLISPEQYRITIAAAVPAP
jgi:hypothetical protein